MSVVDICNRALVKLGESRITSLDDESKAARILNLSYEPVRDELLRSHPWNCAIKRVDLAPLASEPLADFAYEFQLPSDFLRLLPPLEPNGAYRLEGRKILTNNNRLRIRYVAKVEDPNEMDAMLRELLSTKLAAEVAVSLTQNRSLAESWAQAFEGAFRSAKNVDGMEGQAVPRAGDDWVLVRE